jgi:hypothetical protein
MKNARKNGKKKGRTLTPPSVPDVVKPYEQTAPERAAAQRLLDQRKCRAPALSDISTCETYLTA